jgi:dihydroflavonol-4-reductase
VRVTVRDNTRLENLDFEHEPVLCDVLDRRAVRRAMRGVERVFHLAGLTSLRAPSRLLFDVNVQGTRIVLEEALKEGVQSVVYTSSASVVGPAPRGGIADEQQLLPAADQGISYVASKREAEMQALRLAAKGLPVIIVNPTQVFGPGDVNRSSTEIVRRFLCQEIPLYVEGALNVVDVQDVARGHLLADEHGTIGERYILGNRNFTLDRLFADLARISGVQPPLLKLPVDVALGMARMAQALPGNAPITTEEVRAASLWWAYRSTKAKRELGYQPGHHEDTLLRTIEWYRQDERRLRRKAVRPIAPVRVAEHAAYGAASALRRLGI